MSTFVRCLKEVLVHEGGKVDDPRDPGGRTAYGVIQRVYDAYRRNLNLHPRDVYLIEPNEVQEIYRVQYWDKIGGDRLPPGLSYVVFDGAVNSGVPQSVKWLQRALGVRVDGVVGEATVDAACAHYDYQQLITDICARRMAFLRELKPWPTYKNGWTRRVSDVERRAKMWAKGLSAPAASYHEGTGNKARLEAAKSRPSKGVADAATGGGVASGGLAAAVDHARDQLQPFTNASEMMSNVFLLLVILSLALTAGGIAYSQWAAHRTRVRNDALDLLPVEPGSVQT